MSVISHESPPEAPPKPPGRGAIVAAGLVLLLIAGGVIAWVMVTRVMPGQLDFHSSSDQTAGAKLQVNAPDAAILLVPGSDGTVHVVGKGRYLYHSPTVTAATSGDTTTVTAGCPRTRKSLPGVRHHQRAGGDASTGGCRPRVIIDASGLDGTLDLNSNEGSIEVLNPIGAVSARSGNGSVSVTGARSPQVTAHSTNGSITMVDSGRRW
ncbi:hypothetical protein [Fodinicola feengrottensis]|uniref:hypothetical protein n=1 Tax=Fodinicola feengrottensis TaxID=435914 RepID=UPI0013D39C0F|nr:hypothetical protein [Fodinicola feengrottensis]